MPEKDYRPDFAKRGGLVPAIVQDSRSREVLMLGWINEEAWLRTRESGKATFWSTSRQTLWEKGATSGDWLRVEEIRVDCDDDTVLFLVEPLGDGVCHTKNQQGRSRTSCFYRSLDGQGRLINLEP